MKHRHHHNHHHHHHHHYFYSCCLHYFFCLSLFQIIVPIQTFVVTSTIKTMTMRRDDNNNSNTINHHRNIERSNDVDDTVLAPSFSISMSEAGAAETGPGTEVGIESSSSSTTLTSSTVKNTIDFLMLARNLKTIPRTGWVLQNAGPRIESIADHSWRISLMSFISASSLSSSSSSFDTNRCIKMALVHDLAEATVGDITPHCGISTDEKHAKELHAITEMTSKLSISYENEKDHAKDEQSNNNNDNNSSNSGSGRSTIGSEIYGLWKEYEEGRTEEAKLVKDMDKLEMILQAVEYEQDGKNEKSLDGFFDTTRDQWKTPIGRAWGKEIESRRTKKTNQQQQQQKDVN